MTKLDDYPEAYNVVDFPYRVYQYDDNNVAFQSRKTRQIRLAPRSSVSGIMVGKPVVVRIRKNDNLLLIAFLAFVVFFLCLVIVFR